MPTPTGSVEGGPAGPDPQLVAAAIELASRAPSIHNTQPWEWRLTPSALELHADRARRLSAADPNGRSMLISCGAALHHLCTAMAARGWVATVARLPDLRSPSLLASVVFTAAQPQEDALAWADAITVRRSDRRSMGSWPVSERHVARLVELAAQQGALLQPLSSPLDEAVWHTLAQRVADTRQADSTYQDELTRWTAVDASADAGIPAANVPNTGENTWGVDAPSRFPAGELASPGPEGEPPHSVQLLLGTSSDDPLARLRAGEALSAVLLEATRFGLATALDSQVVEVEATREVLEKQFLGGTRSPQILIRAGWPSSMNPVPPTPRRDVTDVLTTPEDTA